MNYKQIYRAKFEEVFNIECYDIERSAAYISDHKQSRDFSVARTKLTPEEKNEIITRIYIDHEFNKHA